MSDFKAKMYQSQFRLGLHPRPRWESLQRSPRRPGLTGPTCKGRGRDGKGKGGGEGRGREGEGELRGGNDTPPLHAPQSIFLDTPLSYTLL